VTQLAAAFFQVQVAFAWLVDRYKFIAMWYASARRVMALVEASDELDRSLHEAGGIERLELADPRIALQHLTVADRSGRVLIDDASAVIEPGEKVLILGESGVGKSTLMRAIAGLWPWGSGRILVPAGISIAFVPPRPYLPLGTLREAILYPALELEIPDDEIAAILDECGLSAWSGRLDEVERWDQILSSGERQRLAFARLFLQKPQIAILDEATSALDEAGQAALMRLMRSELPATTVVSVGQRPEAEAFHDRCLRLVRGPSGARLVEPQAETAILMRALR
jgi:putative ATP-binding cassette transporter